MATLETAKDRRRLVEEAGKPTASFLSILAGTLTAFGAVALLLAAAGAVGSQIGLTTEGISTDEWRQAGIAGAAAAALALFVAFFFGGYTAGRMGRRAGLLHGFGVFVLAAVVVAVVTVLAALLGDGTSVRETFSDNGVPTDANTWSDIGIGAAIAAGVAMLVGSLLGGFQGDRWHTRLLRSAVDHRAERDRAERDRAGAVPYETRRDTDDDRGVDADREHEEGRAVPYETGTDESDARTSRPVGQDPTTIDVREPERREEMSVEEEREAQRTGRTDPGS